jgi:hypothetical protein
MDKPKLTIQFEKKLFKNEKQSRPKIKEKEPKTNKSKRQVINLNKSF